ncbi:uncharacterized protein LOC141913916 [Tubulanus polymorphus]|uniref:uncharacterized protein LOC141913916 n=1 Tax=Tubulanus polymorphus TaxID=672921 RepID=UPI003DA2F867
MQRSEMLRIGVIGCGYCGKNHVRVLIERGSLAGVCDGDVATVASFRRTHPGVAVYSLDEMLADDSVDAVVIATPDRSHYDLAEQALRAGKHVLVEKPMTLSYAQARRLVRRADSRRLLVTTGHQMLHHNAVQAMLRSISSGAIGDVTTVRTYWYRSDTTDRVDWRMEPHDIDVILAVAGGRMPLRLRAVGQTTRGLSQEVDIRMEFGDGTGLKTTSTMIWDYPVKGHKIVVNGKAGAFVFDDGQPWSKKLKFYPTDSDVDAVRFSLTGTPDASDGGFFVPCCVEEPLKSEHSAFAKAIVSYGDGSTESCAPDDLGIDVLCLLELAHESLESDGSWRLIDEYLNRAQFDEGNFDNVTCYERRDVFRHRVRVQDLRMESKHDYFVHETSVLEPGCKIGSGTKIWLYSQVRSGAVIGPDCQLGQNVYIDAGVTIGRGCKLQNNVSVCRYVTLADGVFCGPSCTFTNNRHPRAEKRDWKPESTVVERGATIGANATVVCGVRIGRYAMIGAGAVVTKDVKAYALVYGNPAVQRGWVNEKCDKLSTDLVCPRTGRRFVVDDSGGLVPAAIVVEVEENPGFPRAKGDGDVDDRRRVLPETTDGETNRKSWLHLVAVDGDQLYDSSQPSLTTPNIRLNHSTYVP